MNLLGVLTGKSSTPEASGRAMSETEFAEGVAYELDMSVERAPSYDHMGRWKACTTKIPNVFIYGYGDSINAAILDCYQKATKIKGALASGGSR